MVEAARMPRCGERNMMSGSDCRHHVGRSLPAAAALNTWPASSDTAAPGARAHEVLPASGRVTRLQVSALAPAATHPSPRARTCRRGPSDALVLVQLCMDESRPSSSSAYTTAARSSNWWRILRSEDRRPLHAPGQVLARAHFSGKISIGWECSVRTREHAATIRPNGAVIGVDGR